MFARLQTHTELTPSPSKVQTTEQAHAESAELNQALRGLYKNPYLGQLFYSLAASTDYLQQSSDFLAQLAAFDCQGANAIKAQRLRNALEHYYIKDIQPYFTALDRQFVELAPLLHTTLLPPVLAETSAAARFGAMTEYRAQVASGLDSELYVRYRQLTLQHAKVWQDFLKRCQLSPTRG